MSPAPCFSSASDGATGRGGDKRAWSLRKVGPCPCGELARPGCQEQLAPGGWEVSPPPCLLLDVPDFPTQNRLLCHGQRSPELPIGAEVSALQSWEHRGPRRPASSVCRTWGEPFGAWGASLVYLGKFNIGSDQTWLVVDTLGTEISLTEQALAICLTSVPTSVKWGWQ